ncbi:MAG: choice-of-anchor J domain-containing protein [Bacteroidales bacterium]|jgi:hypothetical protein|nr:choice-of-anchor J domain-containing protein [Bacteroidales bacterium]
MKKIILSVLAIGLTMGVFAQNVLLEQNFESNSTLAGWMTADVDGDENGWGFADTTTGLSAHNNSNACVFSLSYDNATQRALTPNNYLISTSVAVPANGATLTYWVAGQDPDYYAEHLQVKISTAASVTTTGDFTDVVDDYTLASVDWTERTVDLSNYAGQTIFIAFIHNECTDQFVLKLDDVKVVSGATNSLYSAINNGVEITSYPNPANDNLTLTTSEKMQRVELINVIGQQVYVATPNTTTTTINVNEFSRGNYIARIYTENGIAVKKIILD